MKRFLKKYWTSIALCFVILVLCFINPQKIKIDITMTYTDKIVHFAMFLALSGIVFWDNSFRLKKKVSVWALFIGSWLFPIALSGLIEIAQDCLTSTRTGDWLDFLFDSIGASLGLIVCWIWNRNKLYKTIN